MTDRPQPDARVRQRPRAGSSSSLGALDEERVRLGAGRAGSDGGGTPVFPSSETMLWGEPRESYEAIKAYFLDTMAPSPGLETMLVHTIIDQTREIHQLERARTAMVRLALCDTLVDLMKPSATHTQAMLGWPELKNYARQWAFGAPGAETEVSIRLAMNGMTTAQVKEFGPAVAIDGLDRIGAQIERVERRRDRVVRTFEQSRALRSLVSLRVVQTQRAQSALIEQTLAPKGEPAAIKASANPKDE